MIVTFYTMPDCPPCEATRRILNRYAPEYDLIVEEVNILSKKSLYDAYHGKVPVVGIQDGNLGRLEAPIEEAQLHVHLEIARRTASPSARVGQQKEQREPSIDRLASYIGRHWLRLVTVALGLFVGLPWLAPVFAALGWWGLADPIYTAYAVT